MDKLSNIKAICDNQATNIGLKLAKISSHLAFTPEQLQQTLSNIDPEICMVLVTENLANKSKDILDEYRKSTNYPLITIIPDPHA